MAKEKAEKAPISPEQKAKNLKMLIIFASIAGALLILDLVSKWLVQSLAGSDPIAVIPNFFYISKSYNTAVAFSWGSSIPIVPRRIINILISLIMSALILVYWIKNNDDMTNWDRACAMLLSSGAIGNLIDRAFYWEATTGFDGVIDFLQFYLGGGPGAAQNWVNPFATFNGADAYLTVGVVMLIVLFIVDAVRHPTDDLDVDPRLVEEAKLELEKEQGEKASENALEAVEETTVATEEAPAESEESVSKEEPEEKPTEEAKEEK